MSTLFLSRLCWLAGTTNLAMHQMIILTYKNELLANPDGPLMAMGGLVPSHKDLSESKLLDQATFYHRTNSLLLCLLGVTT
jgi:hypothetical protein